jgi:hypothetical protein
MNKYSLRQHLAQELNKNSHFKPCLVTMMIRMIMTMLRRRRMKEIEKHIFYNINMVIIV